jgi:hypothetical protein
MPFDTSPRVVGRNKFRHRREEWSGDCLRARHFDGDLPVEFFITGEINFAHSARADLPENFIMPETFARFEFLGFGFDNVRDFSDGGRFHKVFRAVERQQKRFDFGEQQFIAAAGFNDKLSAFFGLAAQSRIESFSNLLPIFISHLFIRTGAQVSSLGNAAQAA